MEDDDDTVPYAHYLRSIIQKGMLAGTLPVVTTDPNLLEAQAKKAMSKKGYDYTRGGAGESSTMESNRLAFRKWQIIPRVLVKTTPRDLSTTLFGEKYDTPLLMAPIGVQSLYHEDKEIGTAKACAALRVPFTMSTASSTGIEELAEASMGPKWYQLYWPEDDDITASLLDRAKANGFKVLVVTLDTWTLGWRPTELDAASLPFLAGEGDQKFAENTDGGTPEENTLQASLYWCSEVFSGSSHSWEDLALLRKHWDGPIVLKGILSVKDAQAAQKHGVDGIIVSNHGGRQLDGAIASLDALPAIVDAVGDTMTVMLDSGIRTGADVLKALALGAKAVFVGRPVIYGLGINGRDGAEAVLAGLLADLDLSMGFSGARTVKELNREMLRPVKDGLPKL